MKQPTTRSKPPKTKKNTNENADGQHYSQQQQQQQHTTTTGNTFTVESPPTLPPPSRLRHAAAESSDDVVTTTTTSRRGSRRRRPLQQQQPPPPPPPPQSENEPRVKGVERENHDSNTRLVVQDHIKKPESMCSPLPVLVSAVSTTRRKRTTTTKSTCDDIDTTGTTDNNNNNKIHPTTTTTATGRSNTREEIESAIERLVQQFETSVQQVTAPSSAATSIWWTVLAVVPSSSSSSSSSITTTTTTLIRHVIRTSMTWGFTTNAHDTTTTTTINNIEWNGAPPPIAKLRQSTKTSSLLQFEDHAVELLATCRILVKEVTDDNNCNNDSTSRSSSKKPTTTTTTTTTVQKKQRGDSGATNQHTNTTKSNDDRLFVAIHGLRAILHDARSMNRYTIGRSATATDTTAKIDTIRRLLYFCIIGLSHTTTTGSSIRSSTTRPTTTTTTMIDRNHLSYLAYHALGQSVQGYKFYTDIDNNNDTSSSSSSVSKSLTTRYTCNNIFIDIDSTAHPSGNSGISFPTPHVETNVGVTTTNHTTGSNCQHRYDGMAMEQLCTMCIVATLTIARRMVTHLQLGHKMNINSGSSSSMGNDENDPNNKHTNDSMKHVADVWNPYLLNDDSTDKSNHDLLLVSEIRYLIGQVAIPWIHALMELHATITTTTKREKTTTATSNEQSSTGTTSIVLSYCKKCQRILYDLSETTAVRNNPDLQLLVQSDSIRALLLDGDVVVPSRRQGMKHIDTPTTTTTSLSFRNMILLQKLSSTGTSIYEQACTHAWKVSDSYYSANGKSSRTTKEIAETIRSTYNSAASPLDLFHEQIGALLDSFVFATLSPPPTTTSQNNEIVDSPITSPTVLSYVEYCAYRAFHTNHTNNSCCCQKDSKKTSGLCDDDCLFLRLPYAYTPPPNLSGQQRRYNDDEAFLLLFFLSRYIRYRLEGETDEDNDNNYDVVDDTIHKETMDGIIAEFRFHYVSAKTVVDHTKRLRWYNQFSSLGLHRVAHRILENRSRKSDDLPIKYLDTARIILSDCMAPFCAGLLDHVSSDKQLSQLRTYVTFCYRLSISIGEESRTAIDASNDFSSELTRLLLVEKVEPALNDIESTAKFLYGIGKKRFESGREFDSLFPLLHSIKIFFHGMSSFTPTMIPLMRIPGRLTFIATIYKSLDMIDEAIITMSLALVFDAIDVSIISPSDTNQGSDLFSWLARFTENVIVVKPHESTQISRSEQRNGLQISLLQLMLKRGRSPMALDTVDTNKDGSMNPSAFVDLLLESLRDPKSESCSAKFEERSCLPLHLATIFSSFISSAAIPRQYGIDKSNTILEVIKTMTEFTVRFGNLLQLTKRENADISAASISDYHIMCQFTESLIPKIQLGDDVKLPLITGMLNIVSSISLVSSQPTFRFERWMTGSFSQRKNQAPISYIDQAIYYVARGYSCLSNSKVCDNLSSVTLAALELYRYQLSHLLGGDLYQINFKRVQDICEKIDLSTSMVSNKLLNWRLCLTTTLSRLCTILYLEGEGLRALQVAKWNCDVLSEFGNEANSWFQSVMLTLLAETSIVAIQPTLTESFTHPASFEEQACRLRLYTRDACTDSSLCSIESQFQRLLCSLRSCSKTFGSDFDDLVKWSSTTIYLGLSECVERQGRLETSAMFLKSCFERCRTMASSLKRVKSELVGIHRLWYSAAISHMSLGCIKRQVKCLHRTAILYHRLGNYRKSNEYSFSALKSPTLERAGLTSKSTFAESVSLTRGCPAQSSNETKARRLHLRLKSLASPLDLVSNQFSRKEDLPYLSLFDSAFGSSTVFVNNQLEAIVDLYEIVDMINGYQWFPSHCEESALRKLATEKFVHYSLSGDVAKLFRTVTSLAKCEDEPYLQLQYSAKLRDAADILSSGANRIDETHETAIEWLMDIVASPSCSVFCRAWSYYLLGFVSLKRARRNGDVLQKWKSDSDPESDSVPLIDVHYYFSQALQLLGSSSDLLKRNVQRCLAITISSGSMDFYDSLECFCLINDSVGGWVKSEMIDSAVQSTAVDNPEESNENKNACILSEAMRYNSNAKIRTKFSTHFLKELGKLVPPDWRFITVASCPTGDLLLSSLEFSDLGEPMYFNTSLTPESFRKEDISPTVDVFDNIVKPLNEIVARSQQLLSGEVIIDNGDEMSKEGDTRRWWDSRKQIDTDLQQHLSRVESVLLSSDMVHRVLLGRPLTDALNECVDTGDDLPCGNLASLFEAASNDRFVENNKESEKVSTRKVLQTKDRVGGRTLLGDQKHRDSVTSCFETSDSPRPIVKHQACIFLILDENYMRFPFEGLSCFEGKTICRIPSLAFALAKLSEFGLYKQNVKSFDPKRTSFILDPESNLSGTKERLAPFLDSIQSKFDYQWNSIICELPPICFMEKSLLESNGLLLYFGHGGGQQFYGRGKLESLVRQGKRSLSSVILMGCGSGKLESVNTKHSRSMNKLPIHYEPEGIALSYLMAGSPCVVGNLWDVTDRDIDRYSISMLQSIYDSPDGRNKSIAQSVAEARQVCKMRYIVGCAPVCYGFPITVSED